MEQRQLGRSGITVSSIGLGTFTWGGSTKPDDAGPLLRAYLDAGGTLVDTADIYAGGAAETILGGLLDKVVPRADIVLATKAVGVLDGGRPRSDASRQHLMRALDDSLRRLGTDYVDVWQLHAWDSTVPLEETLSAVDDAISSGRVRHAGICNYAGWQTVKAATAQQAKGHPLVTTQVEYSLLERGIEREVLPAAADQGLGVLAWAALGRGVLTGKYREGVSERRLNNPMFMAYNGRFLDERSSAIVETVWGVAEELGVTPLAVALSWVRDRPGVTAALIGARNVDQLSQSLAAEVDKLTLPQEALRKLDDASAPHVGYPESGI
ncbi:MAG TPA: aldo/keto reductase [Pseudonocardiaceae bacterium]|nr:aldo/keto reductase [Pseudonocardiaceae bacterium]